MIRRCLHFPFLSNSLIVFVDEADAFLRKRGLAGDGRMTEDTRNALSTFLYRTGDPTKKFMLVFSTNEPTVSGSERHEEDPWNIRRLFVAVFIFSGD